MDERITITIEGGLLEKVDKLVDKRKIRSRSHAFEIITREYFDKLKIKNAVVLCGGGVCNFNKIVNGDVVLTRIIDFLKGEGIENVFITVDKRNRKNVEKIVGGDETKIIDEDVPLGTGGALIPIKEQLGKTFLVINGDVYFDLDLEDLLMYHRKNKGIATLCLTSTREPMDFGVAVMKGSKIVEFVEKPKIASSYLINAGIFVAEPEIFNFMPKKKKISLELDVLPEVAKSERLFGYLLSSKWFDVGKMEKIV